MFTSSLLKNKLEKAPVWVLSLYAALTSFAVYFCMYAFRKPFTAAGFEGFSYWNIDYKIWLVTAQVIGYMLSKFYGIRFISAMKGEKRAATIIKLIIASWLSLLLFGFVPAPCNIIFLLLNGFPLGMVWGLVFAFAEGRRTTEFIGAVLCSSFSLSSGVVKTVGKSLLLNWNMSEFWMPFATGALFLLPMLLFVWLLNHVPPPTEKDIALRSVRPPMTKEERKTFLAMFMPGIITIVITYVLLTILRDFRDNFANELYTELGYGNNAAVFTTTEIPVSLIVLLCIGLLTLVKHNFKAFIINHYIIIGGYTLALISTLLFTVHYINPIVWMMMVGTGLYLSYVPFNALYFERMIASYKIRSNVGFIMYVADAFGYLGSVLILIAKEFIGVQLSWTSFFTNAVIIIAAIGITGTAVAAVWFKRKYLFVQSTVPSVYG